MPLTVLSCRLWVLKAAIVEFLRRMIQATWERTWQTSLHIIRVILAVTFVAVVISNFVECRPFSHYWQVTPDPGGQCRQGYVQLITMAVCNAFTDLLLVIFPIPIIVTSLSAYLLSVLPSIEYRTSLRSMAVSNIDRSSPQSKYFSQRLPPTL